jgi:hypothetical protein
LNSLSLWNAANGLLKENRSKMNRFGMYCFGSSGRVEILLAILLGAPAHWTVNTQVMEVACSRLFALTHPVAVTSYGPKGVCPARICGLD